MTVKEGESDEKGRKEKGGGMGDRQRERMGTFFLQHLTVSKNRTNLQRFWDLLDIDKFSLLFKRAQFARAVGHDAVCSS